MKTTFIILSPQANPALLKSTINSIKLYYPDSNYLAVISSDVKEDEELNKLSLVIKGGTTISSLINAGIKNSPDEWNFLIFEGSHLQKSIKDKFFTFIKDKKDIGFPIIVDYDYMGKPKNLHSNFVDGSMNGILIHKETFKKIGNLTDNPLPYAKLLWSLDAISKGCTFKGILGAKIC